MSEYSFTAAAAIGSYYHEAARGQGHLPGIFALEHYVSGILQYPSLLRQVTEAEQDPKFQPPTFDAWVTTPEAEAAIATRVHWQERYEEQLAAPVKEAFYRSYGRNLHEGHSMEALFFAHDGEQLVVKRPLPAERAIGVRSIEAAVSALVLQDEVHPTLEQIRGFSYARGIVTVQKPGKPPMSLSPDELEVVKPEHMEFALEGLVAAAFRGAKLDSVGQNMVVAPDGSINFFDFIRLSRTDLDYTLEANFNGFLRLFNDAAITAPKPEREKIRGHLRAQALKVMRAADPDYVPTEVY